MIVLGCNACNHRKETYPQVEAQGRCIVDFSSKDPADWYAAGLFRGEVVGDVDGPCYEIVGVTKGWYNELTETVHAEGIGVDPNNKDKTLSLTFEANDPTRWIFVVLQIMFDKDGRNFLSIDELLHHHDMETVVVHDSLK